MVIALNSFNYTTDFIQICISYIFFCESSANTTLTLKLLISDNIHDSSQFLAVQF